MKPLSDDEMRLVLQDFPKFELSYEKMTHKKVFSYNNADVMLAVPEGQKCFAWFTSYKDALVCFILDITDTKEIKSVKIVLTSFDDKLALGTVFYGTMFTNNGIHCFAIEDLYFYKGKNYLHVTYLEKLKLLTNILHLEMSQNALTKQFTIFGLPLLSSNFNTILKDIDLLPYKVSQIKFRFFGKESYRKILFINYFKPGTGSNHDRYKMNTNNTNSNNTNSYNTNSYNINQKIILKITADVEPDIYNLFLYKNGKEEYYDVAHIPDYKTSVMMNKLFRNIKENHNLDALEESDNEEEFENVKEDKYVYLDRSFKMYCEYNSRFRKWVPISLADKRDKIVLFNQLPMLHKKY